MGPQILGWFASIVLVVTIGYQVFNQWRTGSSRGVSLWLFVGQFVASSSFMIYAMLIDSMVFIVTNALLALSAVAGFFVCRWHRRRAERCGPLERGVHHVGLAAADWEASRRFYEEGFGASVSAVFLENGRRVAMLRLGDGCRIELFETPAGVTSAQEALGSSEDGEDAPTGSLVHLAIGVEDVPEATARLERCGARVARAPENTRLRFADNGDGTEIGYSFLRGPSGELLELIHERDERRL